MGIGDDKAVAGEMLADVGHAGAAQAGNQGAGERRHRGRIAMEGAVADDFAGAVVEIEHRREAEIDAASAQLGGQHIARGRCRVQGARGIAVPQRADRAHRRQHGKSMAEALHAATFVVDGDQQRRLSQE
jgi:hypothetical protein